jgi:hypothetical protein
MFIPYEITEELKKRGFDEPCLALYGGKYGNEIITSGGTAMFKSTHVYYKKAAAPLWQQVIDWFREKHKIWIQVNMIYDEANITYVARIIWANSIIELESNLDYYKAMEIAINRTLKLIKSSK